MRQSIDSFLNHLVVERGFSQNTLDAYRNDLYQFVDYLSRHGLDGQESRDWHKVDPGVLVDYVANLRRVKGYRDTTLARKVAAVKSFFGFLVGEGVLEKDPSDSLSSPRVGRSLPKFLTEGEVERLLEECARGQGPESSRDLAILELLYATGLRVSELVALNLGDVNLKGSYIRCLGKGGRERVVYMYPRAVETLRQYMEKSRPLLLASREEKALFVNRRGDRLTRQWVWAIIKNCAQQAGSNKRITPHVLRHSFATHMLRGGAPLRHVQELLGHSSITTTQVYTHLTDEHLRQEYDSSHPRS